MPIARRALTTGHAEANAPVAYWVPPAMPVTGPALVRADIMRPPWCRFPMWRFAQNNVEIAARAKIHPI